MDWWYEMLDWQPAMAMLWLGAIEGMAVLFVLFLIDTMVRNWRKEKA